MAKWLIGGIIVFAFLLRVPFLSLYPIGFTPDEASFGYDAYSILHTGKDQWGHMLPLVLESFGDFKAPLYTYVAIPFVAIFGLNENAVRLPNALLGVGAVWVVYKLVTELLSSQKGRQIADHVRNDGCTLIALTSAFLLAISPWHIQLSRGAFEANMISFLLTLGLFLFFKGLTRQKYLVWSSIVLGLSLFSYHSAKVVVPLIVAFIVVMYWKELKQKVSQVLRVPKVPQVGKRDLILASLIFIICIFFTAITFFQGAGRRASDVSIFNGALEAQADARYKSIQEGTNPTIARILHNKYFVTIDRFVDNYTSYFSTEFLFVDGPRESTYGMMQHTGVLYWFELALLLSFLIFLFKNKKQKYLWILVFWLFISPIPASLTQGVGHAANRAATMIPVLQIIAGIGLYQLIIICKQFGFERLPRLLRILAMTSLAGIVIFSLSGFLKNYIFFSPITLAKPMLYGNMEVAEWLKEHASDKTNIIVSNKLSEPHIYIAFVNKWNPKDYQRATEDWNRYKDEGLTFLDQLYSYRLGKYNFKRIDKEDLVGLDNTILVGKPEEFPDSMEVIKRFMYPDGSVSLLVVAPYKDTYAYVN